MVHPKLECTICRVVGRTQYDRRGRDRVLAGIIDNTVAYDVSNLPLGFGTPRDMKNNDIHSRAAGGNGGQNRQSSSSVLAIYSSTLFSSSRCMSCSARSTWMR